MDKLPKDFAKWWRGLKEEKEEVAKLREPEVVKAAFNRMAKEFEESKYGNHDSGTSGTNNG